MGLMWAAAEREDHQETLCKISTSLLKYVWQSLEMLDVIRRSDMYFDDKKLPPWLATAIDNLAADYARAIGGEQSENLARRLEARAPTREKPKMDMNGPRNE